MDAVLRNASLYDLFAERTGLDGGDKRVILAANPDHHRLLRQGYTFEPPDPAAGSLVIGTYHPPTGLLPNKATRRRGRPEDEEWNACVMATMTLVDELNAMRHLRGRGRRHDFVAVAIAMMWPGRWGPHGHGSPWQPDDGKSRTPEALYEWKARALENLHDRIKDTYYRLRRRNKTTSKRNKATLNPTKTASKRRKTVL